MKKTWKVKNKDNYSDEELIEAIKNGSVKGEDFIISDTLKDYIKVSDSIALLIILSSTSVKLDTYLTL